MKKKIIIFLLTCFILNPGFSQAPSQNQPSKSEMQAEMKKAMDELANQVTELEKQIAEAKKNREDPDSIKQMEQELAMLKKQLSMMGGVSKSLSGMSSNIFQQAADEGKNSIPGKDSVRINRLPKKIFTDAELLPYLQRLHAEVEGYMLPTEKTEARNIYNEIRAATKSSAEINNAATGCWVYGHWEKALWLAGKACLDDMSDPDNLNNYAAFLTMVRGEHGALPILRYLNKKYPENSTVLNNIGQAWFGMGDILSAKKYLDSATKQFPNHSTANLTLSTIYLHQGDSANAILALRKSLRNCFSVEKAAALERLGEELDDDDIDFDYPMNDDPLGFEPFFDAFPSTPGSVAESARAQREWEAFGEAAQALYDEEDAKADSAGKITSVFIRDMSDSAYNQPVLKLHNSTAYFKAGRKFPLAVKKKTALSINEVMNMMAEAFHQVATNRLNALEKKRRADVQSAVGCGAVDAANSDFMSEAKVVIDEGRAEMKKVYRQNKNKVDKFLKLTAYSSVNDYNKSMEKFHEDIWKKNQWIFAYTANFASAYRSLLADPPMPGKCNENVNPLPAQTWPLPVLKTPDCPHTGTIELTIGTITERCNTCTIDESKLKVKQDISQKGEVQIGDSTNSTARGPQKQESLDPAKTTTIDCNKLGPVKVDRARPNRAQRCTVNSDRSSLTHTGSVGSIGPKLMAR